MAVYEHVYKPYEGALTPPWSRFLIIPRYAFRDIFRSKLLTGYFAICFVYPLVAAIIVYLHHNANALAIFQLPVDQIIPINNNFFRYIVATQARFAFLLALFVGPALIASDLANNGLPLYLSRPFSRVEYVLGKISVLLVLLSAVTWVPGLLVYGLQAYLEGASWVWNNAWIAGAVFVGSWAWILTLSLLALAISAFVRWSLLARAAMFGIMIVPAALAGVIDAAFQTRWGDVVSLQAMASTLWLGLFRSDVGTGGPSSPPAWLGGVVLALLCAVCVGLLARKVRAYEVVR
jgi:ABC-2 type transport system permease protein